MNRESQPTTATDVSTDPPRSDSEQKRDDSTPSKDQPASTGHQTGQGGDVPEPSEDDADIVVEYHRKGKGSKPMVVGKPPKH